ncbi:MAG: hypothetical protein EZS26_000927 [Candidatus Ordinivivax streblomastigis]|uniref:Uncharacterized protein n=1 Tax=Candidatus Ordinivivax streblomastigis TaxID=2540710 RepID=A0A5M8P2Q1_9BACT|nr:MAG: hypothetical protein EZS26_000927 [Candidatus Ordinivivax streblomastigis]
MKKNVIILIIVALFSCFSVYAERSSFRDRTEQWLQPAEASSSLRSSGNGLIGGENPPQSPNLDPTPVGDALPIIILLAGIYIMVIKRKKRYKMTYHLGHFTLLPFDKKSNICTVNNY